MKARIFLMLVLGFVLSMSAIAQHQPLYTLGPDTLTNGDTVYVTIPRALVDRNAAYDVSYQVEATQLSGTTNLTATHQRSNPYNGDFWITTADSIDLDGSSRDLLEVAGFMGSRTRLQVISTGTQSTAITTYARVIKRE